MNSRPALHVGNSSSKQPFAAVQIFLYILIQIYVSLSVLFSYVIRPVSQLLIYAVVICVYRVSMVNQDYRVPAASLEKSPWNLSAQVVSLYLVKSTVLRVISEIIHPFEISGEKFHVIVFHRTSGVSFCAHIIQQVLFYDFLKLHFFLLV